LIGIANNGTWTPPNCGPSTFVNYTGNVSSSAQVAFNLDADSNPVETLVDGVETVMTRDADERVTGQTFGAYASPAPTPSYGGLTYQYDADGNVIDKNGTGDTVPVVNIPPAASATYGYTDQVTAWNNNPSTLDHASNIETDPANGIVLTWTARNQVGTDSGFTEQYDGMGRREANSSGLNFLYDGGTMIGWSETGASYNFTRVPGGGALAGSFTANGTTTTWVPLLDASGSTIALVNAANVGAGPTTTYTYDPSGTPTVSGASNFWPFQYDGMEQEYIDAPYYYSGSGQFYSPRLMRSLSEVGQTSSQSAGGLAGNAVASPSGGSGINPVSTAEAGSRAAGAGIGAYFAYADFYAADSGNVPVLTVALVATAIYETVEFFLDIFGGSSHPPTPRELRHQRHPLYSDIIGLADGLTPDQMSVGKPKFCVDPCVPTRPLTDDKVLELPQTTTPATPTPTPTEEPYVSTEEATTIDSYLREDPNRSSADIYTALIADHVEPTEAALLAFGPNPGTPRALETPEP
jgi:hypothetical protein